MHWPPVFFCDADHSPFFLHPSGLRGNKHRYQHKGLYKSYYRDPLPHSHFSSSKRRVVSGKGASMRLVQDESGLFIKGRPVAVPEKFVLSLDGHLMEVKPEHTFQTCTVLISISGKPHAVASEEVSELKHTGHRRQGHRTDASWRYSEG